jgi:hypothetical protein
MSDDNARIRLVAKIAAALAEYDGDKCGLEHTLQAAKMLGWDPGEFITVTRMGSSRPPLRIIDAKDDQEDVPFDL